jgi:hypothetical protein
MYTLHLRRAYGQICGVARDNSAKHALKRFRGALWCLNLLIYYKHDIYLVTTSRTRSAWCRTPMPSGQGYAEPSR